MKIIYHDYCPTCHRSIQGSNKGKVIQARKKCASFGKPSPTLKAGALFHRPQNGPTPVTNAYWYKLVSWEIRGNGLGHWVEWTIEVTSQTGYACPTRKWAEKTILRLLTKVE